MVSPPSFAAVKRVRMYPSVEGAISDDNCGGVQSVLTCDSVAANTESSPFFRNRLGEPDDTRFRDSVVGLSSVAVQTRSGRNVDDAPVFLLVLVLDTEVRGSLANDTGYSIYQLQSTLC
jgi:hypothetical protein